MTDAIKRRIAADLASGPAWIRSYQHQKGLVDAMIEAGHVGRTKPQRGKGRNMIGLTAAGATHYGLTVDPSCLIEPLLARLPPRWRRPEPDEREQHKSVIAEHVSRGGAPRDCAEAIGMSATYCAKLWYEIVKGYGWQAA